MAARMFVPTDYPLVELDEKSPNYGKITSQWRRFQEGVSTALAPGAINSILTSDGASFVWQKVKNANIDAAAAIAYSKLSLAVSIVNADIAVAAAIVRSKLSFAANDLAWALVDKSGSSLADLATRSYADVTGLASSTYTPTLTNVANLAASTAYACQYLRVGPTVTVSGRVDVDPTLAATSTQLGISLPVASALAAIEQCAGTAFASGIAGQGAAILADVANVRAQMQWISTDITNQAMFFTFTYRVI